jgi:hypothetical protein
MKWPVVTFSGGALQRYGMQIVKRCFHQHPGYDLDAAMREVDGKIEFDLDHMTGGKPRSALRRSDQVAFICRSGIAT